MNNYNIFKFIYYRILSSLILILNFDNIIIHSFIIFPLEYLPKENYKFYKDNSGKSPEEIIQQIYYKNLITKIEIGTPPKAIPTFIKINENKFHFTSINPSKLSIESNKPSNFYNFNKNELFNESLSSSYKENNCKEVSHLLNLYSEICDSKDIIIFHNSNGNLIQRVFPIKIVKNLDENIPGVIGLLFNNTNFQMNKSLITLLREENIIDSYYYFFSFEEIIPLKNKIKGNLIIGGLPHEIFPEKYSLENFQYTNSYIAAFISSRWRLSIDKTYLNEDNKDYKIANNLLTLSYDIYHIIGTYEFHDLIKDNFMDELIENQACFYSSFPQNINGNNDLHFYYCKKSIKDILYKNLNSIKFLSLNLDYTFELNKEELYYIKDNFIFLNILFSDLELTHWTMGQVFTTKYNFVFNTDQKTIGFYKNENIIINDSNSNNGYIVVICFFICILVFTFLGVYIGKKIFRWNRKIIKNELIEELDYEYKVDKNNNIELNIKQSNYKSIGKNDKSLYFEMKNKIRE